LDGPVTTEANPSTVGRPPALDVGLLAVAVVAVSTSGPLIAAIAAPALAVAAWRSVLGAVATAPFAWRERRTRSYRPTQSQLRLMVVSGLLLGAHFATWVPSLRYTSVASSTALVATQPIWAALLAARAGVRIPRAAWAGIAVAFGGVLTLTGVDIAHDPATLLGDALALVGGMLAAAYVTVGQRARQDVPVHTYNATVYATAGLGLVVVCLVGGQSLGGFTARDWWLILALTAGAQLLGHSVVNKVLKTTSATVVSLAILFEVPGATLIAAWWLGQTPPLAVIPAVALLFAGLAIVIVSGTRRTPVETPPV
jgi:drug/metabolite transporter (DMT)-like permease